MFWLFGQIWLWLLLAFVLGVVTTALVLRWPRRERPVPPETPAERTDQIPAVRDEVEESEKDSDLAGGGEPEDDTEIDTERGRRSGTLPVDWPPAS